MSSIVVVRKLSGLQHGHLVVVEIDDLRGVLDDRRGVGGDDVFVLAHADDQRAALAGDDQRVRLVLADDRDAVRALDLVQRRLHRALEQRRAGRHVVLRLQLGVQIADQHRQHFGVGLAGEGVALLGQELLERGVVFDDAVVDQRDPAGVVAVRVGVDFGRRRASPSDVRHADLRPGGSALPPIKCSSSTLIRPTARRTCSPPRHRSPRCRPSHSRDIPAA